MTFANTPTGGKSYMQSYEYLPYQPSKSQCALISFNFKEGVSRKRHFYSSRNVYAEFPAELIHELNNKAKTEKIKKLEENIEEYRFIEDESYERKGFYVK